LGGCVFVSGGEVELVRRGRGGVWTAGGIVAESPRGARARGRTTSGSGRTANGAWGVRALPVVVRPRARAPRGDSATMPPAFQTPPRLRRTRSTSPADSNTHAARAVAYRDYFQHRPHTSLP